MERLSSAGTGRAARGAADRPLRASDLDYALPERLVATRPAEPRDSARLLVMRRSGGAIEHRRVRDLPAYLGPGDVLVFNDTAVTPARLRGRRAPSGGRVEGLFIEEASPDGWRILLRHSRRLHPGSRIELFDADGAPGRFALVLGEREPGGTWIARVEPGASADEVLDEIGGTPIPPYIDRARRQQDLSFTESEDRAWYQTVYAERSRRRSVAAPTAGLHFTPALLGAIDARGVRRARVTLHVGPGTFRPIATERVADHVMHRERYEVPPATVEAIRAARGAAGASRVIAVGTTSVRALESLPDPLPAAAAGTSPVTGRTDLFITPPYGFRHVDGMLTNFHLPRSTLLALVAAMTGLEPLRRAYEEAKRLEYRFYSYGDAMLILP